MNRCWMILTWVVVAAVLESPGALLAEPISQLTGKAGELITFGGSSPPPDGGAGGGDKGSPGAGASAVQATPAPPKFPPTASGSGMAGFDAYLDNHLRAPASPEGLFGVTIKQVEEMLRNQGAKNYSYAFGKYSRMTLSVYLLTLHFDRYRRLGMVTVEPRPPFNQVDPVAQQYFLQFFLKGAKMEKFRTVVARERLEIQYWQPPVTFPTP